MKKYLLDTNICIFYIKGQFELDKKIFEIGPENCFISEMTVAELKYGVENSKTPEIMRPIVESFIAKFAIIPIHNSLDLYTEEKSKLWRTGQMVDDFDILIEATSIFNKMVMVINNINHLNRLSNIIIEGWTSNSEK